MAQSREPTPQERELQDRRNSGPPDRFSPVERVERIDMNVQTEEKGIDDRGFPTEHRFSNPNPSVKKIGAKE